MKLLMPILKNATNSEGKLSLRHSEKYLTFLKLTNFRPLHGSLHLFVLAEEIQLRVANVIPIPTEVIQNGGQLYRGLKSSD